MILTFLTRCLLYGGGNMFLIFLGIFVICCLAEEAKDSYDAYKYKKSGGFYAKYPCFKPKPWEQEWIDKCNRNGKK